MKGSLLAIVLGFCLGASAASDAQAPRPDWPFRDGDAAASRFSPLTQITPGNVSTLAPAWTFDTGAKQSAAHAAGGRRRDVRGCRQEHLGPRAGDGQGALDVQAPDPVSRRGVAYWPGDGTTAAADLQRRGRATWSRSMRRPGELATGFGDGGYVDLKRGIMRRRGRRASASSRRPRSSRTSSSPAATTASSRPASGSTATSAAGTRRRGSCSGRSTRCRERASQASRPGKARAGRTAPARTCGRSSRSTSSAASSTPRSARRRPTITAAIARAKNLYGNSVVALDASTGKPEVAPAARPPRSVGLRPAGRADAHRREAGRPDHSGRRRDHEGDAAVHLRPRDRRADLRHRGTAGAGERRARRADLADAAVSAQAAAARPHRVRSGQGLLRAHTGARRLSARSSGTRTQMYTKGTVHAAGRRRHDGDLPEHARRRQLERPVLRPGAGPRVHQRHEHRPGREDGRRARRAVGGSRPGCGARPGAGRWAGSGTPRRRSRARRRRSASWWRWTSTAARSRGRCRSASSRRSEDTGLHDPHGHLNIGGTIATASGLLFVGATNDRRFRAFDSRTGAPAVGDRARGERALGADDVPGQGRPPVRGRRGRRRQLPRVAAGHEDRGLRATEDLASPGLSMRDWLRRSALVVAPARFERSGWRRRRRVPAKKHVLAWADVRNGYQHESISHALAAIERLGHDIRRLRHLHPHRLTAHHQAADHLQVGHRHRHRRAVPGPQPRLLRRDLLLRRPRDRSRRPSSGPTCCRS